MIAELLAPLTVSIISQFFFPIQNPRTFAGIVVYWNIPIFQKDFQVAFLVQCICKCFPYFTVLWNLRFIRFQVRKESIHQWFYHKLTLHEPVFRRKIRQFSLFPVNGLYLFHDQMQDRFLSVCFWYHFQCTLDYLLYRLNNVFWVMKEWLKLGENGQVKRKQRNFMDRSIELWIGIMLDKEIWGGK